MVVVVVAAAAVVHHHLSWIRPGLMMIFGGLSCVLRSQLLVLSTHCWVYMLIYVQPVEIHFVGEIQPGSTLDAPKRFTFYHIRRPTQKWLTLVYRKNEYCWKKDNNLIKQITCRNASIILYRRIFYWSVLLFVPPLVHNARPSNVLKKVLFFTKIR